MKPLARRRWFAATALAALVTCGLAATGLFAPCHQDEAPMSCCPDSSQAQIPGAQATLIAAAVVTAAFEMPVATMAGTLAVPARVSFPARQRSLYLRLSTLLI